VVEILTLMNLLRRDRRDAWFDPRTAAPPLEWLRRTFAEINNGRHPGFSLPARIELVVPELVAIGDLSIRIVDTRGIDQLTARADLETHLEDPHTLSILCSTFNDAPSQAIHQILSRAREIGNPQLPSHCSILVLPRPDEAMAVKDESGIGVDSAEDGYEIKSEQVANALVTHGLESLPIAFFNSLEDDAGRLLEYLDDRVIDIRRDFQHALDGVLSGADKLLANLEEEQVHEIQREVGRIVAAWVAEHSSFPQVAGHVHDTLLQVIASVHPATVHAAVRREGEWESLSYSHQLGHGARRLAVASLRPSVEGFDDLCRTLSVRHPVAAELLSQAERLMTQTYEALLRKVQLAGGAIPGSTPKRHDDLAAFGGGVGSRVRLSGSRR
jgi:hypothetical protein